MSTWSVDDIPSQQGKTAVVTGANSGIGLAAATQLAVHGAAVVLACRDEASARDAAGHIAREVPGAVTDVVRLDLASLASVRKATDRIRSGYGRLDLLVGGEYYGPDGFLGWSGRHPKAVRSSRRSHDTTVQRRLWTESERLTGVATCSS